MVARPGLPAVRAGVSAVGAVGGAAATAVQSPPDALLRSPPTCGDPPFRAVLYGQFQPPRALIYHLQGRRRQPTFLFLLHGGAGWCVLWPLQFVVVQGLVFAPPEPLQRMTWWQLGRVPSGSGERRFVSALLGLS
ncbi:hypothetical protein GQ55_5G354600 [Panicum hallii var. hallii]|uniref:Uncharacterized protein n=1 Tax=Panicum hallii var. hallii TaxID=1504633 RepID=A0A2T7DMB8_9POAL|nr:hypothetical protein GQ55_5G354600 [Panicum hallii var. hallii]